MAAASKAKAEARVCRSCLLAKECCECAQHRLHPAYSPVSPPTVVVYSRAHEDFKQYDSPEKSRRARNLSSAAWDTCWPFVLERLERGISQVSVVKELQTNNFHPTLPQLERQLKKRRSAKEDEASVEPVPGRTSSSKCPEHVASYSASPVCGPNSGDTRPQAAVIAIGIHNGTSVPPSLTSGTPSATTNTTDSVRGPGTPPVERDGWLPVSGLPAEIHFPPFECETAGTSSVFDTDSHREQFVSDAIGQYDPMAFDGMDVDWNDFANTAVHAKSFKNPRPWSVDDLTSKDSCSSYGFEEQTGVKLPEPLYPKSFRSIEIAVEFVKKGDSPRAMRAYLKRNKPVLKVDPETFFNGAVEALQNSKFVEFAGCISCMNVIRAQRHLSGIAGSFRDFIRALVANEDKQANARQARISEKFWVCCKAFVTHIFDMQRVRDSHPSAALSSHLSVRQLFRSLPEPIQLQEH